MRTLRALAVLVLLSCGTPPTKLAADQAGVAPATTLSGQLVISGPVRGDAILLLFNAERPPSPKGSGRPVSFLHIPAAKIFGSALRDATVSGPFSTDYTFSLVPPGRYLVTAVLDGSSCLTQPSPDCRGSDFDPFYSVTREPNGGDLVGGHVDATGQLAAVAVGGETGAPSPVTQVQVVLGRPVVDRPAFKLDVTSPNLDAAKPTFLELQALRVQTPLVDERNAAFLVRYVDDDGDGKPDLNSKGLPLLWPKIFVRKLADADPARTATAVGMVDENDAESDGILDVGGKSYDHKGPAGELIPADEASDLVLLATALTQDPAADPATVFVPTQLYAKLADANGKPDMTKVLPLLKLKFAVLPIAVDASNPAQLAPLLAVPPGRYQITVQQFTGQTWRIPNELQPLVAAQRGFTADESQALQLVVP